MSSLVSGASTAPANARPAQPEVLGAEAQRLAHLGLLFRRSLGSGHVHPLLPVLREYHGVTQPLPRPVPASPVRGQGSPDDAPRAPITAEALQRAIADLPSLPRAVHAAMAALHDERAGAAAIADSIERDQGLTARTLRAANTAFYGATGRVATIRSAITVLGLSTVAALLAGVSLANRFPLGSQAGGFDFPRFWCHALTSAFIARGLAPVAGFEADVAFTAGLLHDVGELALASAFPVEYGQARQYALHADLAQWEAERAVLGVDHGVAGEWLARRWHLPATITTAISAHHAPAGEASTGAGLADLVQVADALAHGIASAEEGVPAVPEVAVEVWVRLGIGIDDCVAVLHESGAAATALCEVLTS